MDTREILVNILSVLKKHDVVDRNVNDSIIDTTYEEDDLIEDYFDHAPFDLFDELIEKQIVSFDIDCIVEDGDYVALVKDIAKATRGEWSPQKIKDSVDKENETAFIEFTDNGKIVKWEFGQEGGYIAPEFSENLFDYFNDKLTGAFISLGDDTGVTWIYLPKSAAEELIQMDIGIIKAY